MCELHVFADTREDECAFWLRKGQILFSALKIQSLYELASLYQFLLELGFLVKKIYLLFLKNPQYVILML